jgi:hypothetical protein
MFDTEFLGQGDAAAAPAPDSSVSASEPTVDPQVIPTEPVAPVEPVPAEPTVPLEGSQPSDTPPTGEEPPLTEDEEAEFKKILDDPSTPKFARAKIEQAMAYAGKLKTERNSLQTEFETFRSQYEGKESLSPTDLERLRSAEQRQYALSSYTASPEDVLQSLNEIVAPQKLQEVKNHLAWDFLVNEKGEPDVNNLQVVIDAFSGSKEGDPGRVQAKDVLSAIGAMKRGSLQPDAFQEFSSDAEYQAYLKATEREKLADERDRTAKANAEFQERSARQTVISGVASSVQAEFQPKVERLLEKFQLQSVPNEPKVATEFKQYVKDRISAVITDATNKNKSLNDVFTTLKLLSEPTGSAPDRIQSEIHAYISSFPYQTALSRGTSELLDQLEKTVTAEAYRYSLMMEGYAARAAKGQTAREVINSPNQTAVLSEYTPDQLAKMSANERRHHTLMNVSNSIRESLKKDTPRFGG